MLIDGVSQTVKPEMRNWESGFLGILFKTWDASTLGMYWLEKESWEQKESVAIWIMWKNIFLVLLHTLGKIKITKYFKYELRFNSVFSRKILHRIYMIWREVVDLDGKVEERVESHYLWTEIQLFLLFLNQIYYSRSINQNQR